MIKKIIFCKECNKEFTFFIKRGEELKCPDCQTRYIKILYKPLTIYSDNEITDKLIGELTKDYIEENKQVLEQMKQERDEWNS